jgi:hypothetical protein
VVLRRVPRHAGCYTPYMAIDLDCPLCHGPGEPGWICEEHLDKPMEHDGCSAPGAPCPKCNPTGDVMWADRSAAPAWAVDWIEVKEQRERAKRQLSPNDKPKRSR